MGIPHIPIHIAVALLFGNAVAQPVAAPEIACDIAVHDFGVVSATGTVSHGFSIRNRGAAPLAIGDIRACCGSTARVTAAEVAPGEKAMVEVELSLLGRSGPQDKSIYVVSNDPRQPYFRLRLTGRVEPPAGGSPRTAVREVGVPVTPSVPQAIAAMPPELVLVRELEGSRPTTRYLALNAAREQGFRILRIDCPIPGWTAKAEPTGPGRWRVRLDHLGTGTEGGGGNLSVRIATDHPDCPELNVPVRIVTP